MKVHYETLIVLDLFGLIELETDFLAGDFAFFLV
jgi:hypothetical protein